jgi:hypothetical protein
VEPDAASSSDTSGRGGGGGGAKPAGRKKPWWETEEGEGSIAMARVLYGGIRNEDNTLLVEREQDDFESEGLLEPSVRQGARTGGFGMPPMQAP